MILSSCYSFVPDDEEAPICRRFQVASLCIFVLHQQCITWLLRRWRSCFLVSIFCGARFLVALTHADARRSSSRTSPTYHYGPQQQPALKRSILNSSTLSNKRTPQKINATNIWPLRRPCHAHHLCSDWKDSSNGLLSKITASEF